MTTNYGERPGLTVDGDREYWRGKVAEVERERDAARAEAARLRAALRRSYDAMTAGANGCHKPACDAMLADAILEAGAALRATEAGKDGAK